MGISINLMVGGEAGQGVQAAGIIIARAFARYGLSVFADQDYESRVRGGHNFFRVRGSDRNVSAISEQVDILIALNRESIDLHHKEVNQEGVVIFDHQKVANSGSSNNLLGIPAESIALETTGNKQGSNVVAVGAALALLGYDVAALKAVVLDHFGSKESGQTNAAAAIRGFEYAKANFRGIPFKLNGPVSGTHRMLLNGNEALALAALTAGCKFVAAYPMTPSTSIIEYLASKADEFGMVIVQPEDEISAINMVIGAAYAGVRSMTATSGGGFCLMVEGLGLAGMIEAPIVVVDGQRPGPAIGLPTRTEQGDLQFVINAAHGDFPRAVLAPATIEDVFWLTVKAFNLAEEYQVPVIILTDQHLASSYATMEKPDLSKVQIRRGQLISQTAPADSVAYRRYRITTSGVSPRAFPMQSPALVISDSDEHDEEGHLIEDAGTRIAMMLKRLRKLEGLREEIAGPGTYGTPRAEITLIGWGSTCGALRETVDLAAEEGLSVNLVHFSQIWPFPVKAAAEVLQTVERSFAVENNASAQFARLLRSETGHRVTGTILKFDGRPFTPAEILRQIKREVA